MPDTSTHPNSDEIRKLAFESIEQGDQGALKQMIYDLHSAELAKLLESMPPRERSILWENTPEERNAEVLVEVQDEVRDSLIQTMDKEDVVAAVTAMDVEDLADVIVDLSEDLQGAVQNSLDEDVRAKLETSLSFEENTAGRLMDPDLVAIHANLSVDVVLGYLKRSLTLPVFYDGLFVVDYENRYLGKLPIEKLLGSSPAIRVSEIMEADDNRIPASTETHEIGQMFERYSLVSAAVVHEDKLLGRITVEEVYDILREEADHALLSSAGLNEDEDLFAPIVASASKRTVWLAINLITAFLAAWVIGRFSGTLEKMVALAVLMPVVASMGGIAGSQTLTLTIRGLALNQISQSNMFWLARKELLIGVINGTLWAAIVGLVAWLWFHNLGIAVVISVAITINLIVASTAGILIPLLLNKLGIDPALSGAVILTTVTDVIGFVSFLGLATVFLLQS